MAGRVTVYTVGYEGSSPETFIARLRAAGVRALVDVREVPMSRKKGFSKSALAASLAAHDIAYRHERALGCPKPVRDRHRADGDWHAYTRDFLAHLAQQSAVMSTLAAQVGREATALLCYEADVGRCHRTYVARAVARTVDADVVHLTDAGAIPDRDGLSTTRTSGTVAGRP